MLVPSAFLRRNKMEYEEIELNDEEIEVVLAAHYIPHPKDVFIIHNEDGLPVPKILYRDMSDYPEGTEFNLESRFLVDNKDRQMWLCIHIIPEIEGAEAIQIALPTTIESLTILTLSVGTGCFILAGAHTDKVIRVVINGELVINASSFSYVVEEMAFNGMLEAPESKNAIEAYGDAFIEEINKIING